jgi:hypothetical protein
MKKNTVKANTILVDGIEFCWSVFREQCYANSGSGQGDCLGLAILVESKEPSRRSLLLQFDYVNGHRNMPSHQRFKISDRRLVECIQNALSTGWDPESRGKQFVFNAGSAGPA